MYYVKQRHELQGTDRDMIDVQILPLFSLGYIYVMLSAQTTFWMLPKLYTDLISSGSVFQCCAGMTGCFVGDTFMDVPQYF